MLAFPHGIFPGGMGRAGRSASDTRLDRGRHQYSKGCIASFYTDLLSCSLVNSQRLGLADTGSCGHSRGPDLCILPPCSTSVYARWARRGLCALRTLFEAWGTLWYRYTATYQEGSREDASSNGVARSASAIGATTQTRATEEELVVYLITYTLRPKRDITALIMELQRSAYWAHYLDDTWLIASYEPVDQVSRRLLPYFLQTDSVIILEVTKDATAQGWLPKEAWDWLNDRKREGWMR